MMFKNPPNGTPRVLARLAYDDVALAVAFLERAFGFRERVESRIDMPDGAILLTEVDVLDSCIMLGKAGAHGLESPAKIGSVTQALIVYVDDIDTHFEIAKGAGTEIISEPADQFWGDRRYEVRDMEGHLWSFHEHLRDVSPEEMSAAIDSLKD